MKYHSFRWWLIAISEQFKHIVRNILCRKLMKISFGYTKADLLSMYITSNQEMLYRMITSKYPELRNIRKYIKDGTAITVTEFNVAGLFQCFGGVMSVFWTNEGDLEDIYYLLNNSIPVNLIILNALNSMHSVLVVGFDDEEKYIIVNDPLGDPWLKYKFVFGFNVIITLHKLSKIAGKKMKISFYMKNEMKEVIKEIKQRFNTRKLYSLEAEDYKMVT